MNRFDKSFKNVSTQDKSSILKFIRKILEESTKDISLRNRTEWIEPLFPNFPVSDQSGAPLFITLKKGEDLRGCIGTLRPGKTLLHTVAKTALQSAFEDYRFHPLERSELSEITVEVSILSPMQKINRISEIVPGQHGVYVRKNLNAGIFLPQVWEQIPKLEDFLNELCHSKAGLSKEAWKHPETEIYIFTVEHFAEGDAADG